MQSFLSSGYYKHIVEQNDIHFNGFSTVEDMEGSLQNDLSSGADYESFAGLLRKRSLQNLVNKRVICDKCYT